MNVAKKIFVGCLVMLLSTTPLLVTAETKDANNEINASIYENESYCLGTLTVIHDPFYYKWFENKGARMEFEPNESIDYPYQFCEVDGKVWMNFCFIVRHRLNAGPYYINPRYTLIDHVWINYNSTDYFNIWDEHLCDSDVFKEYRINLTPDVQKEGLPTNGKTLKVLFWLDAGVDAGKFNLKLPDDTLWRLFRYSSNRHIYDHDLLIEPIQC